MTTYLSSLLLGCSLHAVSYHHHIDENISAHILVVDPSTDAIELINCDEVETPSAVAQKRGAIAAINGGFYHGGEQLGQPNGILQIDSKRLSPTFRSRGALGFNGHGENPLFDRLDSNEEGTLLPFFHPENNEQWNHFDHILGSTPILVSDGAIVNDFNDEKVREDFLALRFSRSAVGLREDGLLVFVMVEGSQNENGNGMTIAELAEFMLSQNCTWAINLCGGYSSTFYYKGEVIHSRALIGEDENGALITGEKPVGNVIVICEKNEV